MDRETAFQEAATLSNEQLDSLITELSERLSLLKQYRTATRAKTFVPAYKKRRIEARAWHALYSPQQIRIETLLHKSGPLTSLQIAAALQLPLADVRTFLSDMPNVEQERVRVTWRLKARRSHPER